MLGPPFGGRAGERAGLVSIHLCRSPDGRAREREEDQVIALTILLASNTAQQKLSYTFPFFSSSSFGDFHKKAKIVWMEGEKSADGLITGDSTAAAAISGSLQRAASEISQTEPKKKDPA